MGRGLTQLLQYDGADFEDVFALNFTFNVEVCALLPRGSVVLLRGCGCCSVWVMRALLCEFVCLCVQAFGAMQCVELKPGGEAVIVTQANKQGAPLLSSLVCSCALCPLALLCRCPWHNLRESGAIMLVLQRVRLVLRQ